MGLNPLAKAVIELKGTNTTDLSKVETQAFGYKNNQPGCNYVITSNFEKLRFYIDNAVDYEEFNLFQLSKERFDILWLCLSADYLLKDIPKKLKDESLTQEENVTKKLYKDYASFRNEIFDAIQKENPEYDKLTLFKKTQKLLDRFLFIFFAEDRLLLPPNSIRSIINQWKDLRDKYDEYFPLYDRFKKYFGYMNTGHKGQQHDIFAYNGGLFAPDEVLDNIKINDDLLYKHTLNLSNYDFESEVSVNILGHIFEHSLNDIDEIQAELSNNGLQPIEKTTKRKKDGVFYTPKYITKYIVDNTVGKLCEEKKAELDICDTEYEKERKGRPKATLKKLTQKLEDYRTWLLQITICDPACGSGAFLNQALEFLIAEHRYIDELQAKLFGDAMVLSEVENAILENNIYGVDINEESVEIAKLSLWLRTAQKGRKLTSLNNNIKCGNSLIDDPTVAGDKAFNWQKEFPEVFKEKDKKAYHITTALHDSRTSQRMIDYKVRQKRDGGTNPLPNYTKLSAEEEISITEEVIAIAQEKQLNIMAYNICGDHIHLLLVCEEEEVPKIMQKIKGRTARVHNSNKGINPLVQKENEKSVPLWTQKYGCKDIKDDAQLHNTINYIQTNRAKHDLPSNKALQSLVNNPILNQDYDTVFTPEYTGGFDVIIGNPPYAYRNSITESEKRFFSDTYKSLEGNFELYKFFMEKCISLIKSEGYFSFITNSSFLIQKSFSRLRKFILDKADIIELIPLGPSVFDDATVDTAIFSFSKERGNDTVSIKNPLSPAEINDTMPNELKIHRYQENKNYVFDCHLSEDMFEILDKVERKSTKISELFELGVGINTGYIRDELVSDIKLDDRYHPMVPGSGISRYGHCVSNEFIMYDKDFVKSKGKLGRALPDKRFFDSQKILVVRTRNLSMKRRIIATIDNHKKFNLNRLSNIISKNNNSLFGLLGFLNSTFFNWLFSTKYLDYEIKPIYLKECPIVPFGLRTIEPLSKKNFDQTINFENHLSDLLSFLLKKFSIDKPSKKLQNWHELEFVDFVKELEKARKKSAKENETEYNKLSLSEEAEWMQYFNEQKQKAEELKAEIEKTDKEIDAMVYELYGLTEDEIAIVEEATA